jgi:hypothetical protein
MVSLKFLASFPPQTPDFWEILSFREEVRFDKSWRTGKADVGRPKRGQKIKPDGLQI